MIKIGFTPNTVTTIGFLGNLAAAGLFIYAGQISTPEAPAYDWVGWAGLTIILSSLFDMLDGQVARIGGMASTFGAMYDSVLDRYCELVTLGGICFFLNDTGYSTGAIITFAALVGSIMVSYVRARAEGLDIECKVGFMQRPERVVVTSLAAIICGAVGHNAENLSFDPMMILIIAMGIIEELVTILITPLLKFLTNSIILTEFKNSIIHISTIVVILENPAKFPHI